MISLYSFTSGFSIKKDGGACTYSRVPISSGWEIENAKSLRKCFSQMMLVIVAWELLPSFVASAFRFLLRVRFQDLMADCSNSTAHCYEILLFGFLSIWRPFNKHPSMFCHSLSSSLHSTSSFFFSKWFLFALLPMIYYLSGGLHFYCGQLKRGIRSGI